MDVKIDFIIALVIGVISFLWITLSQFYLSKKSENQLNESAEAIAKVIKQTTNDNQERREEEWQVVRTLVNEYHKQALSQAKVQFWFSVVAASIGFVIIIMPIVRGNTSLLQAASGIILEAVAALFFTQAAQTRERATALYDRLRTDRERTYALSLVDSIDNGNVRNAVKAELALHMAGLASSPLAQMLPGLLSSNQLNELPKAIIGNQNGSDSTLSKSVEMQPPNPVIDAQSKPLPDKTK